MNIETDLVKKKVFSSSMNPSIQKHSQEYKVLAILRYLYPQKFSTMIHGEAPDLQDNENGVGMEVVSAASENDMRASRAFSELHQTKGGDNEKSEERIRASGYKFVPVQGKKVRISTPRRFFKRSRFKRGAAQSGGALPWQPGANAAAGRINGKRTGAGVLRGLMLN